MLKHITEIARECGVLIRRAHADKVFVKGGNPRNLVTEYDIKVQNLLRQKLLALLPEAGFFGEEGDQEFKRDGFCFICDPIDGTTNFIKNLRHSAVSIALLKDGKPVTAVIYNPYQDEMFQAEKGSGAFLNGQQINTTEEPLQNSLIAFGTSPYNSALHSRTWELAAKSLRLGMDVRRSGAAVLDLADVAAGRYGIFWELELQPWDYAAGSLIVKEAGGLVRTLDNTEINDFFVPTSIVATAGQSMEIFFK